ncbi:hypothetical protein FGADI_13433 [Fusarium gaditjirri]|uniref:Uncharacterized protein n=1 Tax=Fusarium gaditjirri TaxID=282569 RepID=A0A8H4WMU0_9HYPO|nr:hypothetical protein FGADI_13433 [Fusarium gaditjirri]
MFPDLSRNHDKRWTAATRTVCHTYVTNEAKKVYDPLFDFLEDYEVWEGYFFDIKSRTARESLVKTPRWPFRITPHTMQECHPSPPECAECLNNWTTERRKTVMRETKRSDVDATTLRSSTSLPSVPQVALPSLSPSSEIPSNGPVVSVSQPPSTAPSEINAESTDEFPATIPI